MMAISGIQELRFLGMFLCLGYATFHSKFQKNDCYESTSATDVTCMASIPTFKEDNNISNLNYNGCATTHLPKDAFYNLQKLVVLSISCNFSNETSLEFSPGIFQPLRENLLQLKLSGNNIRNFPDGSFCDLSNLTELDLSMNILTDIHHLGFGLDCEDKTSKQFLKTLYIQQNLLKTFNNGTFHRLSELLLLNASSNSLKTIDEEAFQGLMMLSILDISNNYLESLPKQVFTKLSKLTSLSLAGNQFTNDSLSNMVYPKSLEILDLSENRITTISASMFHNLEKLTSLYLSNNQIQVIGSGFSSMPSLLTISMNNAGLSEIKPEAFHSLKALRTLKLNDNALNTIEPGTFMDHKCMSNLQLNGNNFSAVPTISGTINLHNLTLARNNIGDVNGLELYGLENLVDLDLSVNHLRIIKKETFRFVPNLVSLNLSNNEITQIEQGTFDYFTSADIDLNFNNLSTIENLFQSSKLRSISVNNNLIRNFSYSSIPFTLQDLSLNHNRINEITNPLSATDFQQIILKHIDFSHNCMEKIFSNDFPASTKELLLHNNSITYVDEGFLKPLLKLRNLTLHNNKLETLCPQTPVNRKRVLTTMLSGNPFICSCELEWLQNQNMDISINFGYVKDLQLTQCHGILPENARQYYNITDAEDSIKFLCESTHKNPNSCFCNHDSGNTMCYFPCPEKCSCYRSSAFDMAILNCSATNLTSVPVIKFRKVNMLHVFLSGNVMTSIDKMSFESYSNINKLYLNNSQLQSIGEGTFQKLITLEMLQLSSNRIQALHETVFVGLVQLKELYLDYNQITTLHDDIFSPLKALTLLHLNDNFLSNFSVWQLSNLPLLSDVSLQHNNWSCDCEYIDKFRNWLQDYVDSDHHADKLVCQDPKENQEIPMISFDSDSCNMPTSSINVILGSVSVWGSILISFVFLIILATFAFIYHREMQVLIYSRYGVRIFSRDTDENDRSKLFDAFISYSSLDEEFLVQELLPGLEQIENPFTLCLHHRDFVAGAFITDNILEAVEKSRRTIMLLSENFIKSEWCRFEFKTAHIQMMKDRCNRVIIIVLGDIPKDLDPEMKLYLSTNTYLTWGNKLFWEKLYFVLPNNAK